LYTRYLLILAVAVIAVVLLWSDDEAPSQKGKAPPVTGRQKPGQPQPAPWRFRPSPGEATRQPPRSQTYSAPQDSQPAPGYPYSGGPVEPYDGYGFQPLYPAQQPAPQPAPYGGYGYQPAQPEPRQQTPGYGPGPQPPGYPDSGMAPITPYGYAEPPAFRFRPLDEKETSRRYRGQYP